MKTEINSLHEALAFLLQGLYATEMKLRNELPSSFSKITAHKIRKEIENYIDSAGSKMLKLERVFNYLMKEPLTRENAVIREIVDETHRMHTASAAAHLRDILTIGCVQNINAYKIANYRSAHLFAIELELDTATDLLQQILEWEVDTSKALSRLSIEEFNRTQLGDQNR